MTTLPRPFGQRISLCCVVLLIWLAGFIRLSSGQTLNLPPRPANALGGQDFVNVISPMAAPPDAQRENWIYAQVASGDIPNWMRNLMQVTTNAVINSANHTVSYYFAPDYLAIGSDTDYFLTPMTPMLAQRISVLLNCTLPTRRMVDQIFPVAPVKMEPTPIPYNNSNPPITVAWFDIYNTMVWTQRVTFTNAHPLGAAVVGDKKDVVISTLIYNDLTTGVPNPVVIYGWPYPSGSVIQPLYNGHSEYYMDYSHGIRMVQQSILVDGAPNTVSNVLTSPDLAALLSDETTFANNVIPQPYYTAAAVAPAIITQPYAQTVKQGATVSFSVLSAGDPPLTYFWENNSQVISSGTNQTLMLTNVQSSDAGLYSVVVSNVAGTAVSFPARLQVTTSNYPVLFADNFDADSSMNWSFYWGAQDNLPDFTTNWAFNYGVVPYTYNGTTYLIPPAPNSAGATTFGVKFTVNNTNGSDAGVNIYPKGQFFSNNFALKFDMWINYPGGAEGSGASGTTQYAIYGINFAGDEVNWGATSGPSDGIFFANDGDGGAVRDYRAYLGEGSNPPTELIGTPASGLYQSNHLAANYLSLFPTPPSETTGTPGKSWDQVEFDQVNGTLTLKMNGTIIAQRTNTSIYTNGTIMLGLMDVFPSIASPASQCYVLFDNVSVENLSAPVIVAPKILAQPQGGTFNAGATATLAVQAGGSSPISYQWFFGPAPLAGQTNASLVLTNVQPSNAGVYSVQAANAAGSAQSGLATLTISTNWSLTAPQLSTNGFQFTLLGLTNLEYEIDLSTNLSGNWTPVQTGFPPWLYLDAAATGSPLRLYRARPVQ
jgi:Immunoglobulin domain